MFGSGNFGDKSPSWFLKILKLPSLYLGNFKIFKNVITLLNMWLLTQITRTQQQVSLWVWDKINKRHASW